MKINNVWVGYGLGDKGLQVAKLNHRLFAAYSKNSKAKELGVVDNGDEFTEATKQALINITTFLNQTQAAGLRTDGIADYKVQVRLGVVTIDPKPPVKKYPLQGVGYDTTAYLMPPTAHSFNKATQQGAIEGRRLFDLIPGPVIGIGYSMGAKTLRDFEMLLSGPAQTRYLGSFNFGDPSMRPEGSLLGDDPGEGISREFHPDWVTNRYWSYSIDGDWYPRARGLLFFLYKVIARAELTLEFAQYLLMQFPVDAMQELMGLKPSQDDTGAAGVLSGLAGLMTTGPQNVVGSLLNPLQLVMILPQLIDLLIDAIKFATTQAHGRYWDPAYSNWDGLTGVDHCVRTIREIAPKGATLLLFPGSWATWDQGFQADAGRILYDQN
jgi:hypothetical protein